MKCSRGPALVFLAAIAFPSAAVAGSLSGTLDGSFNQDGRVTTAVNGTTLLRDIEVLEDGRILVGADNGDDNPASWKLVRYGPNGSLDQSFGQNGKVDDDDVGSQNYGLDLKVLPNGKILAASQGLTGADEGHDWVIKRYKRNGQVDDTFGGGDGTVETPMGGDDRISGLLLLPRGRFLVYGTSSSGGDSYYDFAIARYKPRGSLDTNTDSDPAKHWSEDGKSITNFSDSSDDAVLDAKLLSGGRIKAVGRTRAGSNTELGIAVYQSNGELYPSFGIGGLSSPPFGSGTESLDGATVADGKIFAFGQVGMSPDLDIGVARYDLNGDQDIGFGGDGRAELDYKNNDYATAVGVDTDHRLVLTGATYPGETSKMLVGRLQPNGSKDLTFGTQGSVLLEFPPNNEPDSESADDLVLQSNGRILIGGTLEQGEGPYRIALARLRR